MLVNLAVLKAMTHHLQTLLVNLSQMFLHSLLVGIENLLYFGSEGNASISKMLFHTSILIPTVLFIRDQHDLWDSCELVTAPSMTNLHGINAVCIFHSNIQFKSQGSSRGFS